jgi:hypothetical protein
LPRHPRVLQEIINTAILSQCMVQDMKMSVAKKVLIGLGAVLAVTGNAMAYYMMTATHEETVLFMTTEVFTYERDAIVTPLAIGIIGVALLVLGALVKD